MDIVASMCNISSILWMVKVDEIWWDSSSLLFSSSASSSSSTRLQNFSAWRLFGLNFSSFCKGEGPVLRSFSYVKQNWDFFTFYKQ